MKAEDLDDTSQAWILFVSCFSIRWYQDLRSKKEKENWNMMSVLRGTNSDNSVKNQNPKAFLSRRKKRTRHHCHHRLPSLESLMMLNLPKMEKFQLQLGRLRVRHKRWWAPLLRFLAAPCVTRLHHLRVPKFQLFELNLIFFFGSLKLFQWCLAKHFWYHTKWPSHQREEII